MEMPTVEELRKEKELYAAYLKIGGEPIRLLIELRPDKEAALNWSLRGEIPEDLPSLPWTVDFVDYIKDKVTEAIQPPGTQEIKDRVN